MQVEYKLKIPTLQQAEEMLDEAAQMNPGPWVAHSRVTARAARLIAAELPDLDPEAATILGYLHDIGRREGVHGYGFNPHTRAKWQTLIDIRQDFERKLGKSIYSLLPGVVENTFDSQDLT